MSVFEHLGGEQERRIDARADDWTARDGRRAESGRDRMPRDDARRACR